MLVIDEAQPVWGPADLLNGGWRPTAVVGPR